MINLKVAMKEKKEGSSASSTDDTDVFGDGLDSANCQALLFNCLKNLEVKVKEIFDWLTLQMKVKLKENSN